MMRWFVYLEAARSLRNVGVLFDALHLMSLEGDDLKGVEPHAF